MNRADRTLSAEPCFTLQISSVGAPTEIGRSTTNSQHYSGHLALGDGLPKDPRSVAAVSKSCTVTLITCC